MTFLRAAVLLWIALVATMIGLARIVASEAPVPIPSAPSQAAIASPVVSDQEDSCAPDSRPQEKSAIESIVRRHRPTAEDAWICTLTEAIYVESLSANVDPLMTASIVASESSFQSRVVSHAGAVGLMQLRPFVARDLAERRQVAWNGVETLYTPELNVRLGVLYLNELIERFDGDLRKALTAYNYGPTHVSRMIRTGKYDGSRYAEAILERYERLRGPFSQQIQDSVGRPRRSVNTSASRCGTPASGASWSESWSERWSLVAAFRRFLDAGIRSEGASDHGVSEVSSLREPDGNKVELYRDRPSWK